MVCRFVEYEEVGFQNQHVCQCDTFLLPAAQLSHRLFQIVKLQHGKYLLRFQDALRVSLMIEARIQYALFRVELRALFEHSHTQVVTIDDRTAIITLLAREDGEQGGLPRTVLCHEPDVLPFCNGKGNVFEENLCTETFCQVLHIKIRNLRHAPILMYC